MLISCTVLYPEKDGLISHFSTIFFFIGIQFSFNESPFILDVNPFARTVKIFPSREFLNVLIFILSYSIIALLIFYTVTITVFPLLLQ